MKAFKFVSACLAVSAAAFVLSAPAHASLLGRDINGNAVAGDAATAEFLYDTDLNITWLRDSFSASKNSIFDLADGSADGRMTWEKANDWANSYSIGGFDDWHLPTMVDTFASPVTVADGCNFSYGGTDCGYNPATTTSQMAHLFFVELGNKSFYSPTGDAQPVYGLKNTGSFQNLQSDYYWLGTEYAPNPSSAWSFYTTNGYQHNYLKTPNFYAMAVRDGDVLASAVPEPESYAMMLAGLAMVGALRRRRALGASGL